MNTEKNQVKSLTFIRRKIKDKDNPYIMVSTSMQNGDLTLEELGVCQIILSFSDDFEFKIPDILKRCKNTKETTIKRIFSSLEKKGHITKSRKRDEKGVFTGGYTFNFSEEPQKIKTNLVEFKPPVLTLLPPLIKAENKIDGIDPKTEEEVIKKPGEILEDFDDNSYANVSYDYTETEQQIYDIASDLDLTHFQIMAGIKNHTREGTLKILQDYQFLEKIKPDLENKIGFLVSVLYGKAKMPEAEIKAYKEFKERKAKESLVPHELDQFYRKLYIFDNNESLRTIAVMKCFSQENDKTISDFLDKFQEVRTFDILKNHIISFNSKENDKRYLTSRIYEFQKRNFDHSTAFIFNRLNKILKNLGIQYTFSEVK